jgi:hypothetical protein
MMFFLVPIVGPVLGIAAALGGAFLLIDAGAPLFVPGNQFVGLALLALAF